MSNYDKKRNQYLLRKYGITIEQYEKALKLQNYVCAICHKPPKTRRLAVDHCHKTKRVRGLLDMFCNHRFLGRGRERPVMHERAATYLRSDFDIRKL